MNSARLKVTWPLTLLFCAYPIWWLLGIASFIWIIIAIPMVMIMISERRTRAPVVFSIWLAFLAWVLLSGLQIASGKTILTFSYRFALYLVGAVLFLYVYNLPRMRKLNDQILRILTIFWMIVVAGGYAGILLGSATFTPPFAYFIPHSLRNQPFVQELVQPVFAQVSTFLGHPVPRPAAPFAYTNNWGGIIAVLTFVAIASIASTESKRWRRLVVVVLVLSVVPMVFSLNRGMFLSLIIGVLYVIVRMSLRGSLRALGLVAVLVAAMSAVIVLTPLGHLITSSFSSTHGGSNQTRLELYQQATAGAASSPLFGDGAPKLQLGQTSGAAVGTQGQLWAVLYSDGYPALFFFVAFFVAVLWQTRRAPGTAGLCLHAVPVVALAQIIVYGWLPAELQVVMVVSALSYRLHMRPASQLVGYEAGTVVGNGAVAEPARRKQPSSVLASRRPPLLARTPPVSRPC